MCNNPPLPQVKKNAEVLITTLIRWHLFPNGAVVIIQSVGGFNASILAPLLQMMVVDTWVRLVSHN